MFALLVVMFTYCFDCFIRCMVDSDLCCVVVGV